MAAAYFDNGLHGQEALFELFTRSLPKQRSYLIAAGLEQALDYLGSLRFSEDQIEYLRGLTAFKDVSAAFFDYLREFRFTGDVWAMPEGTAAFGMEPVLRIRAPIIEAQIVETFLLATVNFQTMIASKAARVVTAARGRDVIEFGTRRAHGSEAGLLAARAAYIGGCGGTSNVEAGFLFGIPVFGTLAHSFVMSFDEEDDAFKAFLRVFPATATMLVDTYDTLAAVERLARDFEQTIPAIRLDSGDLLDLSIRARRILDERGLRDTKVFASSDLDEHRIADLLAKGARIDAFGVGTQLATSYDAPALGGVYKLIGKIEGDSMIPRMKLSADKMTYPVPKQVWRQTDEQGRYVRDIIAMEDESEPRFDGQGRARALPLLEPVMKAGEPIEDAPADERPGSIADARQKRKARLDRARARAAEQLRRLPEALLSIDAQAAYDVKISDELQSVTDRVRSELTRAHRGRLES
jgi:nicotinate phosphoribosyltransferase